MFKWWERRWRTPFVTQRKNLSHCCSEINPEVIFMRLTLTSTMMAVINLKRLFHRLQNLLLYLEVAHEPSWTHFFVSNTKEAVASGNQNSHVTFTCPHEGRLKCRVTLDLSNSSIKTNSTNFILIQQRQCHMHAVARIPDRDSCNAENESTEVEIKRTCLTRLLDHTHSDIRPKISEQTRHVSFHKE